MISVKRATSILSLGFIGMAVLFELLPTIAFLSVELSPAFLFFGWLFVPQFYWPTDVRQFDRPMIYCLIFWVILTIFVERWYLVLFAVILMPQLVYNSLLKWLWSEPQTHSIKLYICVLPFIVFAYLGFTQQFNWLAWALISATNILSILIALRLIDYYFSSDVEAI